VHGHIHPNNIFINKDVIFTDYGIDSIKKLASIYHSYTNKSIYTAPEILQERGIIII